MAAKKSQVGKKVVSKAKAGTTAARKSAKKVLKKTVKQAEGLLGKLAQRSAQLILDSGILGKPPKKASAKKRARKA
jgi:hypothetical protein